MKDFLGIDTSNYTTSAAIFSEKTKKIYQYQKALPVKVGSLGLRQNDAVFEHVKALPNIISTLIKKYQPDIQAVGVSVSPRDVEGSYMPSFLVGKAVAEAVASTHNVSCHHFSHQAGHIMAALYSSRQTRLLMQKFIAFHVSGGTTEMLLVHPDKDNIFKIDIIGKTLDISAGQVIDRVGKMLNLSFPAGIELEYLAKRTRTSFLDEGNALNTVRENNCNLSGLENKCSDYFFSGMSKYDVAKYCLDTISKTLIDMISNYNKPLPIVFSGGVMANVIIKDNLFKYVDNNVMYFPQKEYATDNAVGTAILAAVKESNMRSGF